MQKDDDTFILDTILRKFPLSLHNMNTLSIFKRNTHTHTSAVYPSIYQNVFTISILHIFRVSCFRDGGEIYSV